MNATLDDPRVIVALDFASGDDALAFARGLSPGSCRVKVGKELFVSAGPALVESLHRAGFEVFLDLKFHDIPNTVAQACLAAARLGVWMMNVHASGGSRMMRAAREILERVEARPKLVAVTVLTSLEDQDLAEIGMTSTTAAEAALRLARLAAESGLDGVVCSAREVPILRNALGSGFLLVTPGIRPAGADIDDQARIATPSMAIREGASYLVIGRPITRAADPRRALEDIRKEIEASKQE